MRAALGLLPLEEALTVLTAGTAAAAIATLYCGINASDIFLVLVGIFAFGVAGFAGSARWTVQRKLLRVAQWLHWGNLALYFFVGCLICAALGGYFHWAYAHPGPAHARLLTGLLDMAMGEEIHVIAPPTQNSTVIPTDVWAIGGGLDRGVQETCTFPFTFEGKEYEECASGVNPPVTHAWSASEKEREHPWCMVDVKTAQWGYCLYPAWQTGTGKHETVVHSRISIPHQAVILLFVVMCMLIFSSFSIGVLEALEIEDGGERNFNKEGWRGYGALDAHGPPAYAPGYAAMYAPAPPNMPPRMAQRSAPPHPAHPGMHPGEAAFLIPAPQR